MEYRLSKKSQRSKICEDVDETVILANAVDSYLGRNLDETLRLLAVEICKLRNYRNGKRERFFS